MILIDFSCFKNCYLRDLSPIIFSHLAISSRLTPVDLKLGEVLLISKYLTSPGSKPKGTIRTPFCFLTEYDLYSGIAATRSNCSCVLVMFMGLPITCHVSQGLPEPGLMVASTHKGIVSKTDGI